MLFLTDHISLSKTLYSLYSPHINHRESSIRDVIRKTCIPLHEHLLASLKHKSHFYRVKNSLYTMKKILQRPACYDLSTSSTFYILLKSFNFTPFCASTFEIHFLQTVHRNYNTVTMSIFRVRSLFLFFFLMHNQLPPLPCTSRFSGTRSHFHYFFIL